MSRDRKAVSLFAGAGGSLVLVVTRASSNSATLLFRVASEDDEMVINHIWLAEQALAAGFDRILDC